MLTDERIWSLWGAAVAGADRTVETFARAVEREARREALEEAARVAEPYATGAAYAIRALIDKEPRT